MRMKKGGITPKRFQISIIFMQAVGGSLLEMDYGVMCQLRSVMASNGNYPVKSVHHQHCCYCYGQLNTNQRVMDMPSPSNIINTYTLESSLVPVSITNMSPALLISSANKCSSWECREGSVELLCREEQAEVASLQLRQLEMLLKWQQLRCHLSQ